MSQKLIVDHVTLEDHSGISPPNGYVLLFTMLLHMTMQLEREV